MTFEASSLFNEIQAKLSLFFISSPTKALYFFLKKSPRFFKDQAVQAYFPFQFDISGQPLKPLRETKKNQRNWKDY